MLSLTLSCRYRASVGSSVVPRDSPPDRRLALHAQHQSNLASALDQMCVMPQWGHFTELPVSTDR